MQPYSHPPPPVTTPPSDPQKTLFHTAAQGISIIADIAAVLVLIKLVLGGQWQDAVLLAAAIVALTGIYIASKYRHIEKWFTSGIILIVLGTTVFTGGLTYALTNTPSDKPTSDTSDSGRSSSVSNSATTSESGAASTRPSKTPSASATTIRVIFNDAVRLGSGQNIDLEKNGAIGKGAAIGDADLAVKIPYIEANPRYKDFFSDSSFSKEGALERCQVVVPGGTIAPSAITVTNLQYCFRTSEGNLAWLSVTGIDSITNKVSLSVQVWDIKG